MEIILPIEITNKLKMLVEEVNSQSVVNLILDNGQKLPNIIVYNCEKIDVLPGLIGEESSIVDVELVKTI